MGDRRRPVLVAMAALVLLVASLANLQVHRVLAARRTQLTAQRARSALVGQQLRGTNGWTAALILRRQDLHHELDILDVSLLEKKGRLDSETTDESVLEAQQSTINTCLVGVRQALASISAGQEAAAVAAVSAVSSTCLSLVDDGSSGGPVYPFDFPDPDLIDVGGTYYAYGTNSAEGNVQILSSTNLLQWTGVGNALPSVPAWATGGSTWAPAVIQIGTTFLLFYTVKSAATGLECISLAEGTSPAGPFTDTSSGPFMCQTGLGGSIDPDPFVGADGLPYLVWKSEGTASTPPGLWSEQLDPAGTALAPGAQPGPVGPSGTGSVTTSTTTTTTNPAQPASQGYGDSALLGPSLPWQGGVVEGPAMVYADGAYYLFYSANNWETAAYGIGVALCQGPLGPCAPMSTQPLVASGPQFSGPGGPTIVAEPSGALWIGFHGWLPGEVGYPNSRLLFVRALSISGTSVDVGGPP